MRRRWKVFIVSSVLMAAVIGTCFLPQRPSSVEHVGIFDIYNYHFASPGEPGMSTQELWYRGKRIARHPIGASVSPDGQRMIFVDNVDVQINSANVKGNGIYYFDARTGATHQLIGGAYPTMTNAIEPWPGGSVIHPGPQLTPWSSDGRFAVVAYTDHLKPPNWTNDTERVLFVSVATGAVTTAADALGVDRGAHILFRGWSEDKSSLLLQVDGKGMSLPAAAVK